MIKDSGERRQFESGAVRDMGENGSKGRCDLLPLYEVGEVLTGFVGVDSESHFFYFMEDVVRLGSVNSLQNCIRWFITNFESPFSALLELSIHYEEGAKKYEDRNWEKGIPCHCYVDSAIRHYLKYCRGDQDERHDRAVLWNLFGLLWTMKNKPECNDLSYLKNINDTDEVRKHV